MPEFEHREVKLNAGLGVGGLQVIAQYIGDNGATLPHQILVSALVAGVGQLRNGSRKFAYLGKGLHDGNGGPGGALAFKNSRQHVKPFFGKSLCFVFRVLAATCV